MIAGAEYSRQIYRHRAIVIPVIDRHICPSRFVFVRDDDYLCPRRPGTRPRVVRKISRAPPYQCLIVDCVSGDVSGDRKLEFQLSPAKIVPGNRRVGESRAIGIPPEINKRSMKRSAVEAVVRH